MTTKRKSKWVRLVFIGIIILVLPFIIEGLSSYKISDLFKIVLMVSGITVELLGLVLINKEKRQTNQQ